MKFREEIFSISVRYDFGCVKWNEKKKLKKIFEF